ncbi:flagellar assembly peptidoglycan hydrolase FlgJ [Aquabacterium lacunae]|uniref:Peptidoglycan hydrolase FlgJ n=1 Tax=Aquabacterium lacunae TaxID=2528630 RepID=A0A4Q9H443_9BURK|nr:flagellar assembly peptidoglycan hydrolase FlgJ [Aquabacterium lacunae]TBO32715.1 flagellar assembly peptidoglycan hydrolase FlgJ [Aquabacterium lacunae]
MSLNPPASNMSLTMDVRSLDSLKSSAARDSKGSIREAARQLESLFMQELMKSMRSTTMDSGMLDNGATEMGQSMLDTQMSTKMTGMPGGLSDAIVRQLERQLGAGSKTDASVNKALQAQGSVSAPSRSTAAATTSTTGVDASGKKLSSSEQFIQKHLQAAKAAEVESGIPAAHVLGQAALETGWGKRVIRTADGQDSHNLFGIKATSNWTGKVAEVTTTEYIGGVPRKVTAKFRAYDSYEEAFKDHARLLTQSKRYQQTAVAQADTAQGYASGLQRAGYATDPAYADKLTRVINTAVRLQRTLT